MKGSPGPHFWGKLRREAGVVVEWHPLVDHCADVAACCEALLSQPTFRARLARLAGVDELTLGQRARLCVLAALHDLGKFNTGFQAKALAPGAARVAGHVAPGLSLLPAGGYAAQRAFADVCLQHIEHWCEGGVGPLLEAAIAHHGRPMLPPEQVDPGLWRGPPAPLAGIAALLACVRSWFPLAFAEDAEKLPMNSAFQHAFAGLVMLADWVGSDAVRFFPYSTTPGADRMPSARAQASKALASIGLDVSGAREGLGSLPIGLSRFSPFEPRPAQARLAGLALPPGGGTVVLESETGSGKTEAALLWFLRLFQAGAVDGMYFALPTRTAASQIHARIHEAVRRAFGANAPAVVLAVPGYLRVDDHDGQRLAPFEVQWSDDRNDAFAHRSWAAEHPKRFLAGAIVVGTVDQVLLSVLAVNHAHLRATALLRHLLVVDEVHASDAYMTRLLEEVLTHHRAAGGQALLMSATLGSAARARLLGATATRSLGEALSVPYPLVSSRGDHGAASELEVVSQERDKQVDVHTEPWMADAERIATAALEAARRGGRVLVLRNTVGGCLAVQSALESLAREPGDAALLFRCQGLAVPHHSRFAREDREALDAAIDATLGRGDTRACVVVATQTVQQSLDLDADVLITDLAPLDVLLQRIGRLHRHRDRRREPGFERARATILTPAERDLSSHIGQTGKAHGQHGIGWVYDDLRILEATWQEIERHGEWRIPSMNRALVEATTHPEALAAVVRAGGEAWKRHEIAVFGKTLAHKRMAGMNLVDWAVSYAESPWGGSDESLKTRLGAGDRIAPFETPPVGPFGRPVPVLTIPSFLAGGVPLEAVPVLVPDDRGRLVFTFGDRTFLYDRWGLRPEPTKGA